MQIQSNEADTTLVKHQTENEHNKPLHMWLKQILQTT